MGFYYFNKILKDTKGTLLTCIYISYGVRKILRNYKDKNKFEITYTL